MIGANGFTLERFTSDEITALLIGKKVGDEFNWRGETVRVTKVSPFECHCLWDIEK